MKSNLHLPLIFGAFLLVILLGCGADTKVNFMLNEREFTSVDATPVEQVDSSAFYEIYAGDTVVFKDVSEPQKDDRKRYWNLDGEEGWDTLDNRLTMHVYDNLGKIKVVLCIDNEENCVAKAILVKERPYPIVENPPPPPPPPTHPDDGPKGPPPTPRKPKVKFILPNVYSTNSPTDHFTIHANVWNAQKSDLYLEVNGEEYKSFTLNGTSLRSSVPLRPGKNLVKLKVTNGSGAINEEKEFVYSPGVPATPSIGFLQPQSSSSSTSSDKIDIVVATVNVAKKEQLTLTVGGQTIKDFSFSASTGELKAKVPLRKGGNKIRVTAGSTSTEVTVTLDDSCSGVMFAGVQSKEVNLSSCSDFSVSSGSITLTPTRKIRLMGAVVYSSDCGSINLKLENVSESLELSENKNQLTFNKLDGIELEEGNSYTLTYSTGKSSDCPKGAPQLLNAASCGKNSSGNQCLNLNYNGKVSLFSIKYQ